MNKKYQSSSMGYWIIGFITVAVFAVIATISFFGSAKSLSSKTNREIALTCTTDMATQFHIHPVLKIMIGDQLQEIPTNIGIKPDCMNSIHTHDNTGVIHIEAPEKRDFNLSDFFAVWNKEINSFGKPIKMVVNGKENAEYENYVMQDKDQIELYYEQPQSQ